MSHARRRARALAFLLACAELTVPGQALGSSWRPGGVGGTGGFGLATINYAQSGTVWSTMNQLDQSKKDIAAVGRTLEPKFGTFEEAFSHVAVSVQDLARMSLEVSGEAIVTGRVSNPVLPDLKINALMIGLVRAGYAASRGPWTIRGGVSFGFGPEQRSDAVSTDLIDEFDMREGTLAVAGVDLEASRGWEPARGWSLRWQCAVRETLFMSGTEGAPLDFGTEGHFLAHRWNIRSGISRGFRGWGSVGPEVILGPQPLPVDILPRTWDYVHRIQPLGELGTLFGAGVNWQGTRGGGSGWTLHSGFYGGYLGFGMIYRGRPWELTVGSWGLESSSAYHGLGQRIWQARIGVRM